VKTGSERLIWAQGSPSTLKAVTAEIKGVKITLAAAICWENYMPLLRYSLYSQNVNLYLAPTADFRETWLPLMQTVASEGRTVVLSANQCVRRRNHLEWLREEKKEATSTSKGAPNVQAANGERVQKRRTCSITKTHDNHEVAWPSPESRASKPKANGDLSSPAIVDEDVEGSDLPVPLVRRSSQVTRTEDNHEVMWPSGKDKKSKADGVDSTPSSIPAGSSPLKQSMSSEADGEEQQNGELLIESRPRRASLVTRTEDNHEITWPCGDRKRASYDDAAQSKRKSLEMETVKETSEGDDMDEFVSRGGSCIISPMGKVLAGPLWDVEENGLLVAEVDFEDCDRGRLDLDVTGHYSRNDAFKLTVEGLDLNPPP
jgi:nitrilase